MGVAAHHQAQRVALAYRLCAVGHLQLAHDFSHVVFGCQRTDAQDLANFGIGLAVLHPMQNLDFPFGEQCPR